jgi:nitroimidazol reductase NimA-like FMN-containing flavoprotein (pyridoxamine 5'-phosphate oxidase superfamily)
MRVEFINTQRMKSNRIDMTESQPQRSVISAENAKYLEEARIPLSLACVTNSGWPMVLSLWYIYSESKLWCATQKTAKVVEYLRCEPRCAFEVAGEAPPYRGVRGQGLATLNEDRGKEILERLLSRYLKGTQSPLAKQLLSRSENEDAIEIEPKSVFAWDYSERMRSSLPAR